MADNLRHRYASLVTEWFEPGERLARLAALLAVRDEEMERLREESAYCVEALNGAEDRRQMWRERAEKAERRNAEIRRYIDEDFRFWCSPHGVAGRYAGDLVAFIDRLDNQEADRDR